MYILVRSGSNNIWVPPQNSHTVIFRTLPNRSVAMMKRKYVAVLFDKDGNKFESYPIDFLTKEQIQEALDTTLATVDYYVKGEIMEVAV